MTYPRSFKALLLSSIVSQLGGGFAYVAMMTKYAGLSHNLAGWGNVILCRTVPFFVLGLVGGYLADRYSRRLILSSGELARCGLSLGIAWCSDLGTFLTLVFILGVCEMTYEPAFKGLVASILTPEQLLPANALDETIRSLAAIVGIASSAFVVGVSNTRTCFVIVAGTFLISAISIAAMPDLHRRSVEVPTTGDLLRWSDRLRQIGMGIALLKREAKIRAPLAAWTFLTCLVAYEGPIFVSLLAAKGWPGPATTGYVFGAVSMGTLATSICLMRTGAMPIRRTPVAGCVIVADATALTIIVSTTSLPLVMAASTVLGITETLFRTYSITTIQRAIPIDNVGRVFATIAMIQEPARIVALLLSTTSTRLMGPRSGMRMAIVAEYLVGALVVLAALSSPKRMRNASMVAPDR